MTTDAEMVLAPCAQCHRSTKHDVLFAHHESGTDEYHCDMNYSVVQCRGCGQPSFWYQFSDYESAFPISEKEWEVPKTVETYPRIIENHVTPEGLYLVPSLVRDVYTESLKAIQEQAGVLAGLGLRGTIEAICNERGIKGKTLEKRIAKLASEGFISKSDSERLHAIRFLGNDAAHEIKKPTDDQLSVALRIVEHLIASVYILDAQAKGSLDTIINDYEEFESILKGHMKAYASGDEYPLAKYLGRDVRRLTGALSAFETELTSNITSGTVTWLQLGSVAQYANSPVSLQHFKKS